MSAKELNEHADCELARLESVVGRNLGGNAFGAGLLCAADIEPEAINWLWEGWLAADVLHIIAGAPGTGKTTVALSLAAIISSGGHWPDGSVAKESDVVIWSGEDVLKKTLLPRLMVMGANRSRVHFIQSVQDVDGGRAFDPSTDIQELISSINNLNLRPSLLIIDPIVAAVAGDSHKNAETRRGLQPLVDLAESIGCAVLGVSHFSKGTAGRDVTERVTGSLAFGALARLVMVAAKMPKEEGGGRLFGRSKSNLGPDDGGFRYDIQQTVLPNYEGLLASCVVWGEQMEGSAREMLAKAESVQNEEVRSATEEAGEWLRGALYPDGMNQRDVIRKSSQEGHAKRTVERAARNIGVIKARRGFGPDAHYYWSLPPCSPTDTHVRQRHDMAQIGKSGAHDAN